MSSLQYSNEDGYGTDIASTYHYSQAVTIGNIVKLSGQGGWKSDGTFEDINSKGQVTRAFDNVEKVLQAAGLKGWEDVYSLRTYHTDIDATLGVAIEELKVKCPNHKPIWTAIGVARLAFPAMVIEIEVEAYKP